MQSRSALTLIELVVVLAILAALSGILIPLYSGTIQTANEVATRRTLCEIRDSMLKYWRDTKHVPLDGITTVAVESDRLNIDWLFKNPVTGDSTNDFEVSSASGWRGPYVSTPTGDIVATGYSYLIDAWNHEVVVQDVDYTAELREVRIVSPGPDGLLNIPASTATSALTDTDIGDDIYVVVTLR